MRGAETERAYRRTMLDAICVAVLIAYFLHFAFPALRGGFGEDEMMNMGIYWRAGALKSLLANVLFWTTFYRSGGALYYLPLYHFFALDPRPYRIVQISILAVSMPIIYYLSRRLGSSRSVAFLAVLALCYHSQLAGLVFVGSFIYDVLCGFFYFAALTYYIHVRKRSDLRPVQLIGFLVLYICALDFKEMAVTLPVIVLTYELLRAYRWSNWRQFISWVRSCAVPALMAGLLTVLYIYGKTCGPHALIKLDPYRPHYSWSNFLKSNAHFVSELFYHAFPDHVAPKKALLALWALVFVYAFLRRDRMLRLMAFWIVIVPLPLAFISIRGGACLYLLLFGWAMIFAKVASDFITLISKSLTLIKLPAPLFRVVAMVLLSSALAIFTHWKNQRFDLIHRFLRVGEKTSHVIKTFRSLNVRPAPGSTILLVQKEELFQNRLNLAFLASLVWNDHSLRIWLEGINRLTPQQLAKVDYIISLGEFDAQIVRTPESQGR